MKAWLEKRWPYLLGTTALILVLYVGSTWFRDVLGALVFGVVSLVAALLGLSSWDKKRSRQPAPDDGRVGELAEVIRPRLEREAEQELDEADTLLTEAQIARNEASRRLEEIELSTDEELLRRTASHNARKRGERTLKAILIGLVLGVSVPVEAQEFSPNVPHPTTGAAGYWIATRYWRETLADSEALPKCLIALDKTEAAAHAALKAAESHKTLLALSSSVASEAVVAADRMKDERDAALEELEKWHRSDWALSAAFVAGILVSGVAAIAVMSSVQR